MAAETKLHGVWNWVKKQYDVTVTTNARVSDSPPRIIGYWHHDFSVEGNRFPRPQEFVDRDWLDAGSRTRLLQYLRAAPVFAASAGYSWCRFDCGSKNRAMGSCDFWDGVWVWPEGLSHYVECHDVFLPDEFVQHALRGMPPSSLPKVFTPRDVSLEFWLEWSTKHRKMGPSCEV
jgi:hypothetical protein